MFDAVGLITYGGHAIAHMHTGNVEAIDSCMNQAEECTGDLYDFNGLFPCSSQYVSVLLRGSSDVNYLTPVAPA